MKTPTRQFLWRAKTKEYPFYAVCSTRLKPEHIDLTLTGHFFSIVIAPHSKKRHYGFITQRGRDNFARYYIGFGAKACDDPLPL